MIDINHDRWLEEPSTEVGRLATMLDVDPVLAGESAVTTHLRELRLAGAGTHVSRWVQGVAKPNASCLTADPVDNLVIDRGVNQRPGAGDTGLAASGEDARHESTDGRVDVGIAEDYVRRLSTK